MPSNTYALAFSSLSRSLLLAAAAVTIGCSGQGPANGDDPTVAAATAATDNFFELFTADNNYARLKDVVVMKDGAPSPLGSTDGFGRIRVNTLKPGTYAVQVMLDDATAPVANITIDDDASLKTVTLPQADGEVFFAKCQEDGTAVRLAKVVLKDKNNRPVYSDATDGFGRVRMVNVPWGNYTAWFTNYDTSHSYAGTADVTIEPKSQDDLFVTCGPTPNGPAL